MIGCHQQRDSKRSRVVQDVPTTLHRLRALIFALAFCTASALLPVACSGQSENAMAAVEKFLDLGAFLSSPVIRDGVLYIGSADDHLYALGYR